MGRNQPRRGGGGERKGNEPPLSSSSDPQTGRGLLAIAPGPWGGKRRRIWGHGALR